MKSLNHKNLDHLFIGSIILGSGGGGDPDYFFQIAKHELEKIGSISLINPSELKPDDLIVPVGFIGAPIVSIERIPSGREFHVIFELLYQEMERKPTAIMPFEIGGLSAFTPLIVAAQLNLPIVDADMMGRAFPIAPMTSCHLFGISTSPVVVTDYLGNSSVIYTKTAVEWEKIARLTTVAMGSCAAFGLMPLTGTQVEKYTLHKTLSKALSLGRAHQMAKNRGEDPLEALMKLSKAHYISSGKIVDIDRVISKGFVYGSVTIQDKKDKTEVSFQNEYLLVKYNGKTIATTPDIFVILEQETGTPITTDRLQYGLKVNLIAIPAPSIWTSSEGLALVGPRYFGYDIDYQPIKRKTTVIHV